MDSTHLYTFMIQDSLHMSIIWQYTVKTKSCNNYNKRCFIIKPPPTSWNVTLSWHDGKECNHSMGLYVAIYSSPWKTYLPGQPLHHTVHVYTIQSKHLLKETHSPTYTVNFCKYYKGNLLLSGTFPANFPRGISRLICCFWLHFPWNSNTTGWLTVTCVDNSLMELCQKVSLTFIFRIPLSRKTFNFPLHKVSVTRTQASNALSVWFVYPHIVQFEPEDLTMRYNSSTK